MQLKSVLAVLAGLASLSIAAPIGGKSAICLAAMKPYLT